MEKKEYNLGKTQLSSEKEAIEIQKQYEFNKLERQTRQMTIGKNCTGKQVVQVFEKMMELVTGQKADKTPKKFGLQWGNEETTITHYYLTESERDAKKQELENNPHVKFIKVI